MTCQRASLATAIAIFAIATGSQRLGAQASDSARARGEQPRGRDTTKATDSLNRVDTAKVATAKKTRPAAGTVDASHARLTAAAVSGPVQLTANLSTRQLTVVAGNNAIRTFNVAVGAPAKPTPTGTFKIRKIVWNPSWNPPNEAWAKGKTAKGPGEPGNPMKVAKIFFQEPDYYIHGTAQVNSLGSAESHGCMRMSPDEVAELAQFLMEHDGQAEEEGLISRLIHLRWQTHTVMLSKPVTLTIN